MGACDREDPVGKTKCYAGIVFAFRKLSQNRLQIKIRLGKSKTWPYLIQGHISPRKNLNVTKYCS